MKELYGALFFYFSSLSSLGETLTHAEFYEHGSKMFVKYNSRPAKQCSVLLQLPEKKQHSNRHEWFASSYHPFHFDTQVREDYKQPYVCRRTFDSFGPGLRARIEVRLNGFCGADFRTIKRMWRVQDYFEEGSGSGELICPFVYTHIYRGSEYVYIQLLKMTVKGANQ